MKNITLPDQRQKLDLSHLSQREASEILNIFLDLDSLKKRLDNLPDINMRISKRKLKNNSSSLLLQNELNCEDSTQYFNGSIDNICQQSQERYQSTKISKTKVEKLKKRTIKKANYKK